MYAALWRALPGPVWVRLLLALLALAAVVVVCFTWLFPQLAPLLPLNDPDVRG
ncbi:hypothetical protein [Serinicoccus sp. CUA-874]|uniref:hypothetical protein n=1 Tax=Serinicoccus sp. CUA-874 TaxID=1517939 RepID=UPI001650DFFE|nr:hypothetical protein [Serinicoccus sp. CUA-874]